MHVGGGGGGGGDMISHLCQIFSCYASERMNTSKMTLKFRGNIFSFFFFYFLCINYHVLNECKCEKGNDGAFVLSFCCSFNTKMVATEYS